MVGTSGKFFARVEPVVAKALTLPLFKWGTMAPVDSNAIGTCPARTSAMAGPEPR